MALERIKKRTVFQRFKNLVLGKEKPNLLTRVSLISAFIIWLYLFSWQLLTSASILLMGNLKRDIDPDPIIYIRATYNSIGYGQYGYIDTVNRLFLHSICQIVIYFVILTALILIWRKKKWGFFLYIGGNLSSLLVSLTIMGGSFMYYEIPVLDYILITVTTLYFAVGLFFFFKKNEVEL